MVYKITCNVKNRNPIEKELLQLRERLLSFLKKRSYFCIQSIVSVSLFTLFFNGEYCQGRKPDDKTKGTFLGSITKHNFHG